MKQTGSLVALVFGARILSALLALGMAFIVAPEVFGFYGRLQVIGLVFTVFAFLRLERAVVAAPTLAEAARVTRMALLILPLTAVLTVVASFALSPDLAAQRTHLEFALILLLAFAGRGLIVLVHSWLLRAGRQLPLSRLLVVQATTQFAAQALLLVAGLPPLTALLLGEVVGSAATVASASYGQTRLLRLIVRSREGPRILARWRRLVLFNLPAAVAAQTLVALPLITVGHLADHATTGHIALALRIAEAPMLLLASAATSVAVTSGTWRQRAAFGSSIVLAIAYIGSVLIFAMLLLGAAFGVSLLAIEGRLTTTAGYIPLASFLTAAVALGGPHAELVAYAGAERKAFLIHVSALIGGLVVFLASATPISALLWFGLIALCRSLALWLVLPGALQSRPPPELSS